MTADLNEADGGVDEIDFEECLSDFMLSQFNVEGDDESIEQIGKIMMKVRKQLVSLAWTKKQLWSEEFEKLKIFNEQMKTKQASFKKHYDQVKKDQGEESSDDSFWESEGDENSKEADMEVDSKPQEEDDGFMMVEEKKRNKK